MNFLKMLIGKSDNDLKYTKKDLIRILTDIKNEFINLDTRKFATFTYKDCNFTMMQKSHLEPFIMLGYYKNNEFEVNENGFKIDDTLIEKYENLKEFSLLDKNQFYDFLIDFNTNKGYEKTRNYELETYLESIGINKAKGWYNINDNKYIVKVDHHHHHRDFYGDWFIAKFEIYKFEDWSDIRSKFDNTAIKKLFGENPKVEKLTDEPRKIYWKHFIKLKEDENKRCHAEIDSYVHSILTMFEEYKEYIAESNFNSNFKFEEIETSSDLFNFALYINHSDSRHFENSTYLQHSIDRVKNGKSYTVGRITDV